jgi:hypothetical protein
LKNQILNYFKKIDDSSKLNEFNKSGINYILTLNNETFGITTVKRKKEKEINHLVINGMSEYFNSFYAKYPNSIIFIIFENNSAIDSSAYNELMSATCPFTLIDLSLSYDKNLGKKSSTKNDNEKLIKLLKEKGDAYERFCALIVEKKGFIVKYNGLENGKKDMGIDLIGISKNEILLIQCKHWSFEYAIEKGFLSNDHFASFFAKGQNFINSNKQYSDFTVSYYWFVSDKKTVDEKGIMYANKKENFYLQEIKY